MEYFVLEKQRMELSDFVQNDKWPTFLNSTRVHFEKQQNNNKQKL